MNRKPKYIGKNRKEQNRRFAEIKRRLERSEAAGGVHNYTSKEWRKHLAVVDISAAHKTALMRGRIKEL